MPNHHKVHSIFCITPPHMLREIVLNGSQAQQELALRSITISEQVRGQRGAMTKDILAMMKPVATEMKQRIVYDAKNGSQLPGTVIRQEGDPPASDIAVNEAYDGSGVTYDMYFNVYAFMALSARGSSPSILVFIR